MTVENWIVVALAPVGALIGAAIALFSPWVQGRAARIAMRRANERPSAVSLQKTFNDFRVSVNASRSVMKSGPTLEELLSDEWSVHSADAAAAAEQLVSWRARRAVNVALVVLDQADSFHRYGYGLAQSVRMEMYLAARDGFDVVSAVIRDGRLPGATMRRISKLRREVRSFNLEMADFWNITAAKKRRKPTGLLRRPFKWLRKHLSRGWRSTRKGIRAAWGFLFRP